MHLSQIQANEDDEFRLQTQRAIRVILQYLIDPRHKGGRHPLGKGQKLLGNGRPYGRTGGEGI